MQNYGTQPNLSEWLVDVLDSWPFLVIKLLVAVYCLILIFNIIYVSRQLSLFRKRARQLFTGTQAKPESYASVEDMSETGRYQEINKKVVSNNPSDWKIAVIEADKLFDETLQKKGFSGESLGERLKNMVPGDLPDLYEDVWEAHKIRNQIVHEPDFELSQANARKIVGVFERAMKKMG